MFDCNFANFYSCVNQEGHPQSLSQDHILFSPRQGVHDDVSPASKLGFDGFDQSWWIRPSGLDDTSDHH